jgi:hypothetical protein
MSPTSSRQRLCLPRGYFLQAFVFLTPLLGFTMLTGAPPQPQRCHAGPLSAITTARCLEGKKNASHHYCQFVLTP